ncbi:amino acid/polyamine/organocation transporter, APC superfamily [Terribacillus aidingensis]|uniref:Amino acid/polyamine/organocation transporter, APC superfamily n=1 Tax=Terribacillus aidingensis TaxID=586416 RepID=A0A285MYV2_9BACI|nr:amino acid permease [Terribacillus aidingensis]SNZ02362.1 amino acid/polyamine/organocation transporter, APC superfamily [Terribacillus aidingensis]
MARKDQTSNTLHKGLKNRHVQMIALGGAIGTGLFYGSASSIGLAGPAISLAYLVGGFMIFLIMRALGELSVDSPNSGSISYYAQQNMGDYFGFISGWNYWFNYIAISMAELTVVGIYVQYWFPDIPTWLTAFGFLVLITCINLLSVKLYGEFEFYFAIIKVAAIIGMIILGLLIIFTGFGNGGVPTGLSNLFDEGGFMPNGLTGVVLSLVLVMFSFGGVELIGITAGEVETPKKTIPKAINQVVYRILIFYVGALLVIMAIFPWNEVDGNSSPFVQIFDSVGIPAAAGILNVVVLTAAVSAYNSSLYSNGRMLHSLAQQGSAPKFLQKVDKRTGAPVPAILVSSGAAAITVVLNFLFPEKVFSYLMSIATASIVINWTMIMISQIRFRKRIGKEAEQKLSFKLPFYPISNYLVMLFLAAIVVIMAYIPDYRLALVILPIWIVILSIGYIVKRK